MKNNMLLFDFRYGGRTECLDGACLPEVERLLQTLWAGIPGKAKHTVIIYNYRFLRSVVVYQVF